MVSVGFVNLKENLASKREILISMNEFLQKEVLMNVDILHLIMLCFGHKRLIVIDPEGGKQPMSFKFNENTYTIVYNGQIYNTPELRESLKEEGFTFEGHSDTEVLLKAYILYKEEVVNKLNGIFAFAIWDEKEKRLFMARDHFGVKPLYYTIFNGNFIFASEVKSILKFPGITPVLDEQGISELFGIGPAHTNGLTAFKNIYELKPAHFIIYTEKIIKIKGIGG